MRLIRGGKWGARAIALALALAIGFTAIAPTALEAGPRVDAAGRRVDEAA